MSCARWPLQLEWINICLFMDKYLPVRSMISSDDLPAWADNHFFSNANKWDRAIGKSAKHPTAENIAKAKRLRNQVTAIKRNLKTGYFKAAFEQAGSDCQKIWIVIKRLFGQNSKKNTILEINGSSNNKEMVNAINDYFCDIGPSWLVIFPLPCWSQTMIELTKIHCSNLN